MQADDTAVRGAGSLMRTGAGGWDARIGSSGTYLNDKFGVCDPWPCMGHVRAEWAVKAPSTWTLPQSDC
jgi:hypothetical protein